MTNNPLGAWYQGVSTYTKEHYGPPHGESEWVEYGGARLPAPGVLHRKGAPDLKVEVLSSAGCKMLSSGQQICRVFARQMGPADLIRYRLPTGGQGRATPHRLYRLPSGKITSNPRVIQRTATTKTAWLPASSTGQKPSGLPGSWVELQPGITGIGLVHAPGIGVQHAPVLQVRSDAAGRPRALVRWRQASNPSCSSQNPGVRATTTLVHPDKWWCKIIPGARDCVQQKIEPNPGCAYATRRNPAPVSVASARARASGGRGFLSALRTGRARLVIDRGGVKLVAA